MKILNFTQTIVKTTMGSIVFHSKQAKSGFYNFQYMVNCIKMAGIYPRHPKLLS